MRQCITVGLALNPNPNIHVHVVLLPYGKLGSLGMRQCGSEELARGSGHETMWVRGARGLGMRQCGSVS